MKDITQMVLVGVIMIGTAVFAYATCYSLVWEPQWGRPGDCFGQCTPVGCQTATCIMATGFGFEDGQYNLVSGQGGYPSRKPSSTGTHTCYVNGCLLYNNCTHAYENLPW